MEMTTLAVAADLGGRLRRAVAPTLAGGRGAAVPADGSTSARDSAHAGIPVV